MNPITLNDLVKINDSLYEIPRQGNMLVPARIYTNQQMLEEIIHDRSLTQISNVATLPGIQRAAYAMPDIHQGYGFPIGGVAATDISQGGVISPGGIGYDINCGVRLLTVSRSATDIRSHLPALATELFRNVPSGVGRSGTTRLALTELDKVLERGARYMLEQGYGIESDLDHCEEGGYMTTADPAAVSQRAKTRGHDQLGTLGSGNHFLEVQRIAEIYDEKIAQIFGLHLEQVTIMIHCGSRGLGHQTCSDYVDQMLNKLDSWGIQLPDQELACAPFNTSEGKAYFAAMSAAANFAWANRHMIGHWVRQTCKQILGSDVELKTVYDLSHNIGKKEIHKIEGIQKELLVHRKGATRAFGPNHPDVPLSYRRVGHPVLIPGTMGTSSYILVGTSEGMTQAWGSSCHGAGRRISRIQAKKQVRGKTLRQELEQQGIIVRCDSDSGLAEEAPLAYKDVDDVVTVVEAAGLARKVARVVPIAVIKGG